MDRAQPGLGGACDPGRGPGKPMFEPILENIERVERLRRVRPSSFEADLHGAVLVLEDVIDPLDLQISQHPDGPALGIDTFNGLGPVSYTHLRAHETDS